MSHESRWNGCTGHCSLLKFGEYQQGCGICDGPVYDSTLKLLETQERKGTVLELV